jgi:hypothetical protein
MTRPDSLQPLSLIEAIIPIANGPNQLVRA